MNYEIITNFKELSTIEKKINFKNIEFYTQDLSIYNKIKNLNLPIRFLEYGGTTDPLTYRIHEKAIKNTLKIIHSGSKIHYKNTLPVHGHKTDILDFLIQLETITSIFEEKKENIVFLFSNEPRYFFFTILEIAKKLGYTTTFGISKISDSELVSLDFNETTANVYEFAYDSTINIEDENNLEFDISNVRKDLKFDKVVNPKHAFFLATNEEEYYTKSVYPVIDKFKENNLEYIIFTWDARTTLALENRGYKVYDLSKIIQKYELDQLMLRKKQDFIQKFFKNIQHLCNDSDIVLSSFMKYFKNDRTIRDLTDILGAIEILIMIFENYSFKSIIVGKDGYLFNDLVCNVAKTYGISTYSIPPGMTEYAPLYGELYSAEKLLLSGTRLQQELTTLGVDPNRLIITGNPRYDYISNKQTENFNSNKKMIIIANSRMHKNDHEWMIELIHFCNKMNLEILIKLHPRYDSIPNEKEIMEKKIKEIKKNCSGLRYEISYDADLTKIFLHTNILITEFSLTGVEASLNSLPVIVQNIDNVNFYDHSLRFHDEKIALYAKTIEELFECIKKILFDETRKQTINLELEEGRKKFNHEFNYLNDGNASSRIYDILTNS